MSSFDSNQVLCSVMLPIKAYTQLPVQHRDHVGYSHYAQASFVKAALSRTTTSPSREEDPRGLPPCGVRNEYPGADQPGLTRAVGRSRFGGIFVGQMCIDSER